MIRWLLILILALTATGVKASIPTSEQFGPWSVTSINSVSGGGVADAFATLIQSQGCSSEEEDCITLSISWLQGSDVEVSIGIENCQPDDEFEAGYHLPVSKWVEAGRGMERRIQTDFQVCLDQARLQCTNQDRLEAIKVFDLSKIRPAVRNFTQTLAYLAP